MVAGPEYERLLRPAQTSFFVFGPRGTGKSTWARRSFPGAHWFDLLDEARFHTLSAAPWQFAEEIQGASGDEWVVVDEVQRVPSLLNEAHRLIESRRLRFVLLGSSARKLKTAGTNLLAGRALLKRMFGLTTAELGRDFDLGRVLRCGSLPVVWTSPDPSAALQAYVQLYVREEIRVEALVRNLPGFLRFLPVAALFHGQMVNVSSIARDAGTSRTTVAGYLDILEDTLLATRLPAYEAKLRVRERRHPKLYWVDPGIVRAAKQQLGPVAAEERGPLLEGYVLSTLRAHNEALRLYDDIHYWAPAEASHEVDFLLRRDGDFLALEVKATGRYTPGLLRGLRAIGDLHGLARRILVYTGRREYRTPDGIEVLPFDTFAHQVSSDELWP